jgi:hypothetical protein
VQCDEKIAKVFGEFDHLGGQGTNLHGMVARV